MWARIGDLYAFVLGWPLLARFHKALFYFSGRALGLGNYRTPQLTGEHQIIQRLIVGATRPIVFDVGANVGEWLAAVRQFNAAAEIHAFEPQGALSSQIEAAYPGIVVNRVAVGDNPGSLDLYDYAGHSGSQHASLIAGVIENVHGGQARKTQVPVITLDEYCRERDIDRIDFLKVDVEGFELHVLRGARRLFEEGRVFAVQFELTRANVLGRLFFDDFVACLGSQFTFHRLLPHGLTALHPGNHWFNEQFDYQNVIAMKRN